MNKIQYTLTPVVAIFFLLALVACTKDAVKTEKSGTLDTGYLQGKISIGPLCPVERVPPDPLCQPTKETYKVWAVAVWTEDMKTKVCALDPNLDGTYFISLPQGDYIIDFDSTRQFGIGGSNLPLPATIAAGDTISLDIDIDTGIR